MIQIYDTEYKKIEYLLFSLSVAFPDKDWNKDLIEWREILNRKVNK